MDRLQNMRNNAAGDGVSNCILCGETFSFFTRNVKFNSRKLTNVLLVNCLSSHLPFYLIFSAEQKTCSVLIVRRQSVQNVG